MRLNFIGKASFITLQERGELLHRKTSLANDRAERAARHVAGVIRHRDSKLGMVAMFQLNVAAGRMVHEETSSLKRRYDHARRENRQRRTQIATTTSSRIGWPAGGVSG